MAGNPHQPGSNTCLVFEVLLAVLLRRPGHLSQTLPTQYSKRQIEDQNHRRKDSFVKGNPFDSYMTDGYMMEGRTKYGNHREHQERGQRTATSLDCYGSFMIAGCVHRGDLCMWCKMVL